MTRHDMMIHRSGAGPVERAPEPGFAGDVHVHGYFSRPAPSRLRGGETVFAAGARTPWKVNSIGQTVVVTSGAGLAQVDGGEVVGIGVGDVVWFAPGVRHWEGATADGPMTYVALHEGGVEFGEALA